jgi:alkanesulfonate monooxygenase SsuD/methylene tetrahydromethanopterin reductase-like flavin-dependent oxidoreductase (luciferase family)
MTFFAAAAVRTERILLGTSIVPTWPRHPIVMAQQAQVLASLAPGRFRLGVGPSHRATMEGNFGVDFTAPLGNLREYLQVLKALLQGGQVDHTGRHYRAQARLAAPVDVPVMASALRRRSFVLCGAESDGAISWVCPWAYLKEVALPAMQEGAEQAGRSVPPLIVHAPVSVHDNADEVRAAAREQIGFYPRAPFYASMFADAGYPEAFDGAWSDGMLDAVVLSGSESQVEQRLREILSSGASEVLVSPVVAGEDREASRERTLRLVARVGQAVRGAS